MNNIKQYPLGGDTLSKKGKLMCLALALPVAIAGSVKAQGEAGITEIEGGFTIRGNSTAGNMMSGSGNQVLGYFDGAPALWDASSGVTPNFLSSLEGSYEKSGFFGLEAVGISGDGSVVVGNLSGRGQVLTVAGRDSIVGPSQSDAFFWTEEGGLTIIDLGINPIFNPAVLASTKEYDAPYISSSTSVDAVSGNGRYAFGVNTIEGDNGILGDSISKEKLDFPGEAYEQTSLFRYNIETGETDFFLQIGGGRVVPVNELSVLADEGGDYLSDDSYFLSMMDSIDISDASFDGSAVVGNYTANNRASNGRDEGYAVNGADEGAWFFSDSEGFVVLETLDAIQDIDVREDGGFGFSVEASAISGDAEVIVGTASIISRQDRSFYGADAAIRWDGAQASPEVLWSGSALDVNSDGSVIVGFRHGESRQDGVPVDLEILEQLSTREIEGPELGRNSEAIRYTDATGDQTIEEWLTSTGVEVGELDYHSAISVSDDGNVVLLVRNSDDKQEGPVKRDEEESESQYAIARGAVASEESGGVIELNSETFESLAGGFSAFNTARALPGLALNGAHHRTLMDSAIRSEGVYAWATGDFSNYNELDATQLQGEMGASSDFGIKNFRAGMALGHSDISQDLVFGGDSDIDGQFILAEVDYQLEEVPVVLSALGYYARWDADIKRNYLNAGLVDSSFGSTDIDSLALRLRADWEVYQNECLTLTPRISYTYSSNDSDGYSERGGGFAATFEGQDDELHEIRLGLDADYIVNEKLTLRGIVEVMHTWDDDTELSASVNGLGAVAINTSADDFSGTEFRLGAEATYLVNDNQHVSFALFGSSSDIAPTVSGAISYGIQF